LLIRLDALWGNRNAARSRSGRGGVSADSCALPSPPSRVVRLLAGGQIDGSPGIGHAREAARREPLRF
jgi:hypothetical protein